MRRTLIIWLIGSSTLLFAQSKDLACRSFTLADELDAYDKFDRAIGNGLSLRLQPTEVGPEGEKNGWEISIVRAEAVDEDFIYPVNLPLRFNGVQILGASYNDDAKASLGHPHEMWFC